MLVERVPRTSRIVRVQQKITFNIDIMITSFLYGHLKRRFGDFLVAT